jgi:hypothetical protein
LDHPFGVMLDTFSRMNMSFVQGKTANCYRR